MFSGQKSLKIEFNRYFYFFTDKDSMKQSCLFLEAVSDLKKKNP